MFKDSYEIITCKFYWFSGWYLIDRVGCQIKVLAWIQVEFMGLYVKKSKRIYEIVYKKYLYNKRKHRTKYVSKYT